MDKPRGKECLIKNYQELLSHGQKKLREAAVVGICLAGIAREIIEKKRPFSPPCALI